MSRTTTRRFAAFGGSLAAVAALALALPVAAQANTPSPTSGSGCLTASDGTTTCSFQTVAQWYYGGSGNVGLGSIDVVNSTGRCIQVTTMRLYHADGSYNRLGDAGGAQVQTGDRVRVFSGPFPGAGSYIHTSLLKAAVTTAACTRVGLNGSAAASSGNGA